MSSFMTFMQRLTAVLSDQAEVLGLAEKDLILFGDGVYGGQEVNHGQLDSATERKITRLQTMLFQEEYDGQSLDPKNLEIIAVGSKTPLAQVNWCNLSLTRDSTARAFMLERIITEIVRDKVGLETEIFDMRYILSVSGRLYRLEQGR